MNEQAKGLKIAIALLKKQNDSFKIKCDIDDNSWQFEQAMLAIKQAIKDNGHG